MPDVIKYDNRSAL